MTIPRNFKFDVKKIAPGCTQLKDEEDNPIENMMECRPTQEVDGVMVPLTENPVLFEKIGTGRWRIKAGGEDLTVERKEVLRKAMEQCEIGLD